VYAESPLNQNATKFDNYFRFIKEEKIKLSMNKTCLWERTVKTPLPTNNFVPKIDDRRRSVMEDRRSMRASESPYTRDQKEI
jgi:hypothetical protein